MIAPETSQAVLGVVAAVVVVLGVLHGAAYLGSRRYRGWITRQDAAYERRRAEQAKRMQGE